MFCAESLGDEAVPATIRSFIFLIEFVRPGVYKCGGYMQQLNLKSYSRSQCFLRKHTGKQN